MPHHKEQGSIQHGLGLFVAAISPAHVQLPNNNHKIHADKRSKEKEKKSLVKGWEPAAKPGSQQPAS